jgi:hypothetical protein
MGNQESKSASTISEVGTTDDKKFTVKKGDSERHEEMKDETAIGSDRKCIDIYNFSYKIFMKPTTSHPNILLFQ